MKKIVGFMLAACILCVCLTACKNNEDVPPSSLSETESSSSAENTGTDKKGEPASDTADSEPGEVVIDKNPYTGQTSMGGSEIQLQMYSSDPEKEPATIKLTIEQQNGIAQELQAVFARFESGEYPVEPEDGNDASGFYSGWPKDVGFPKSAPIKQLIFSTVGHSAYPMSVQVALPKGWYMECSLALVSAEGSADINYESEDNIWMPAAAFFIDPNGLVFDQPGESVNDGSDVIVLS